MGNNSKINSSSTCTIAEHLPLLMLIFFASTASFGMWAGSFFMGITPKIEHIMTWWLIVFGVYGINRYTDIEDYLNDLNKREFFIAQKNYLYLAILSLVISIFWLVAAGSLTLYHIICIYAGIAYSVPLFPWFSKTLKIKWIRLKEITFIKSILVSLIIGTSFFALYVMDKHVMINRVEIITLMIGSSLSMFINTIFCDIRDIVGDKAVGIKTIPVTMNIRNTIIYFILFPSILWFFLLVILFVFSCITFATFIFLLLIAAYPVLYIGLYFSKLIPENIISLIADSCVPVFATGLVFVRLCIS